MAKKKPGSGLIDLPIHAQPKRLRVKSAPRSRGFAPLPFAGQVGPGADTRRNDCGPACVRMALDFLNKAPGVTIDALAAQIDAEDNGTNWVELVSLARSHGADAYFETLGPNEAPEAPAIVLIRYNGFARDSVQDKAYWDLSNRDASVFHWAWWLGNTEVNGQMMSVWNDPLFTGDAGKNVLHSLDELQRAYVPYFGTRVAIKFTGIFNPPAAPLQTLFVTPRDPDGVNMRTSPEYRADGANLLRNVPAGARMTVLENADAARLKLGAPAWTHWLRVQTQEGQVGFVAAWLVTSATAPDATPPAVTSMKLVSASRAATLLNAPNGAGVWSVADGAPLRVLPTNGVDWRTKLGNPAAWLEVETYAFKRGFVRGDAVALPAALDARQAIGDAKLAFGDSAWLYGIHDDFGARRADLFGAKKGWVLFTEDVGGAGSSAFQAWAANPTGFGVLVRLNNGYNDGFRGPGTIPDLAGYDAFAQKCASWVQRTMAGVANDFVCTFIIGNEMNNPREWPNPNGDADVMNRDAAITPQGYADCFNRVYRAIKAVAPNARVAPGAVDPYNALYLDCLAYFTQMMAGISALDGFAFHTYTHGPEVSRVTSLSAFQNDPLRWQYYDFMSYTTLMDHVPAKWRDLPVYLTETDQTPTEQNPNAWTGGRNGWVRAAYEEIARWNAQPLAQQIQALILYRWVRGGGSDATYCLQDKPEILTELKDTIAATDLRWRWAPPATRALAERAVRSTSAPRKPRKRRDEEVAPKRKRRHKTAVKRRSR